MTKRVLEIRAGEGGIDSKLFVAELAKAYLSLAHREG
jgi:protein subunit release factor A